MLPLIMPPWEDRDLSTIEQERPFVTYWWNPPLCPWCGQWLRSVDMRPLGAAHQGRHCLPVLPRDARLRSEEVARPPPAEGAAGQRRLLVDYPMTAEQQRALACGC